MRDDFFKFQAKLLDGTAISMDTYMNKTIMVVNTASKCGFTSQYKGLEELYQKFKERGLVILAFPCNQFANQEPGDVDSIYEVCQLNYGVSFPVFQKINVNGKDADPIFKYLKYNLKGLFGGFIKWNFTKFIIDKRGKPVKRFSPLVKPNEMISYIESIL
ncbi:MAG: glutathione peroxidase [Marinifilaceae bacterium]|jgi:glutathione peroxidase|nr:glutathione peroxidase [Marinifilaceae bacterium]